MLYVSIALSLAVLAPIDSVQRVADTIYIEPLGVRATVPALWMGRVPPGATMVAPGNGRLGCQLDVNKPVSERVVTDRLKFATIIQGIYGSVRSSQEALDSILPRSAMVGNVGGDRFNGNCVAPHIHLYVVDAAWIESLQVASISQRIIEKDFAGVKRAESDSASWHVVNLSWNDSQTDFQKPGTLEILIRRYRDRLLVVAVMDGWSDRMDANEFLASIR